jgi:hypothetical protein
MTIEPSEARTVCIRPVMPPKREATIRVPLSEAYLAQLMAEDAKAVRARAARTWGNHTAIGGGAEANANRHQKALAERTALAAEVMEALTRKRLTSAELRAMFRKSDNQMRAATGMLSHEGKIEAVRTGRGSIWRLASK